MNQYKREGATAYRNGISLEKNPYQGKDAKDWNSGWRLARHHGVPQIEDTPVKEEETPIEEIPISEGSVTSQREKEKPAARMSPVLLTLLAMSRMSPDNPFQY